MLLCLTAMAAVAQVPARPDPPRLVNDFAGILGFHCVEGALGEIGDLFLGIGAEEQHMVGIGDVDLLDEIVDRFSFRIGQLALVKFGRNLSGCFGSGGRGLLDALGGGGRFGHGRGRRKGKLQHRIGLGHGFFLLLGSVPVL